MNSVIYKKDLENRFPRYTFNESKDNDISIVEAYDEEETLIARGKAGELATAYFKIRSQLVGGYEITPMLTTAQIGALSDVCCGMRVFNTTTSAECTCVNCESNTWV